MHLVEPKIVMLLLCLGISTGLAYGQDLRTKLVADMEGKTIWGASGTAGKPNVSITRAMASQGKRSLRFEYTPGGKGRERGTVTFFVKDGAKGCNAIAFDVFAHHTGGASFIVSIRQRVEKKGTAARYKAVLNMGHWIDGWTSVRLVRDAQLVFKQQGGVAPDWSKIRTVNLSVSGKMSGPVVYFIDNIRFENVAPAGKASPNMIYNSSFEMADNPDVPDGWTRDLNTPPYGPKVWGIDETTAFHGKKSIRIGAKDKYARSWGRHTNVLQGKNYAGSVYMKADRDGVMAAINVSGIASKNFKLTKGWKRYSLTGQAKRSVTAMYVRLLSDGVLWADAAQLELGAKPTEYAPSVADHVKPEEIVGRKRSITELGAAGMKVPSIRAKRAAVPPRIDGDLNDACWKKAAETTPFVKLSKNEPARRKTVARIAYDDNAFYFAVRAEEPDMKAVNELLRKSRKGPWDTDLIEIFIDLNHDRNTYYHFAANVNGDLWNARNTTKKLWAGSPKGWRCEWTAKGKTDAKGWSLEARIPFTCFDMRPSLKTGNTIGVNVCREDPRNKEHSSWSFSHGGFHTPEAFGEAKGIDANVTPYRYEAPVPTWSRGSARVTVANRTGRDQRLTATFVAEPPKGKPQQASAKATIKAGATADIAAALPLRTAGLNRVFVRLADQSGRVRLVSQAINVRISGAATLGLVGTEFDFYTRETRARARCFIEAGEARCKQLRLRSWIERNGRGAGKSCTIRPTPGINEWGVSLAGLANGEYRLTVALDEDGKEIARQSRRFRKLPPAKHEVRINQWGRFLVCDGKPFFWYGFYDGIRGKPDRYVAALKVMQEAHVTGNLNYCMPPGFDYVGQALDEAQARGVKIWVHLGWMMCYWIPKYKNRRGGYGNEAEAIAAMKEVINRHKEHPALLGWCSLDEPGNRPHLFTSEYVNRYYRIIKEADPHHPCIFSHLTRLGEVKVYGSSTDMVLMPFLERGGRYDQLFWEFWDAGFAIATNSPCYGALSGARREPIPTEQRIRMYKSLILGSRGLCTYTFRCASMGTWAEFKRVGKELQTLAPVLLTPDDRLRVDLIPGSPDVRAVLKAYKGKHYLIAVNVAPHSIETTFRLVDVPKVGRVKPLFGTKPGRVDAAARKIVLGMNPTSTAVYEITP